MRTAECFRDSDEESNEENAEKEVLLGMHNPNTLKV
jgi:hypothetical protein